MDNSNEFNDLKFFPYIIALILITFLISGCSSKEKVGTETDIIKTCIYFQKNNTNNADIGLITKFSDDYNLISINDTDLFDYLKKTTENMGEETDSNEAVEYYVSPDECNYPGNNYLEATRFEQKVMPLEKISEVLSELEKFEMKVKLQNIKSGKELEIIYFLDTNIK